MFGDEHKPKRRDVLRSELKPGDRFRYRAPAGLHCNVAAPIWKVSPTGLDEGQAVEGGSVGYYRGHLGSVVDVVEYAAIVPLTTPIPVPSWDEAVRAEDDMYREAQQERSGPKIHPSRRVQTSRRWSNAVSNRLATAESGSPLPSPSRSGPKRAERCVVTCQPNYVED